MPRCRAREASSGTWGGASSSEASLDEARGTRSSDLSVQHGNDLCHMRTDTYLAPWHLCSLRYGVRCSFGIHSSAIPGPRAASPVAPPLSKDALVPVAPAAPAPAPPYSSTGTMGARAGSALSCSSETLPADSCCAVSLPWPCGVRIGSSDSTMSASRSGAQELLCAPCGGAQGCDCAQGCAGPPALPEAPAPCAIGQAGGMPPACCG